MRININTLLTLIMVGILAFGAYMNSLAIEESTSWNKKDYAQNLIREHNDKTELFREVISTEFRDIGKDEGAQGIPSERAAKIINTDTDQNTNLKVIELLNYLLCLVSAYDNEIADKEMMREGFGVYILKYYHYFENYISEYRRIHRSRSWQMLEDGIRDFEGDLEDHDKKLTNSASGE
jgi:hypothetical protein